MTTVLTSLRNRFLLSLCGVLCLALLALVLIARYQIMPILLEDEETFASAELDRAERALGSELNHMRRLVEDWAYWDDSFDFVSGKRPEYVDSNLYEDTLETLDLELMLFLDADREAFWVVGYDEEGEFTSCPGVAPPCDWAEPARDFLVRHIEQKADDATDTWLLAQSELAMAALSPIHQSREASPAAGWLAMVRPFNAPWIEQLRDTTGIQMELSPVPQQEGPIQYLERVSPTHMAAQRLIPALPPNRAVRIDALLPRQRYQASLETFRFALYWTGGVLIVTLLIVLWLLERMVLLPLRQFTHYTQRVHREVVLPAMPDSLAARHDEIGTLAREFRHLLDHQRKQSEQLLELSQHDPLTGVANRRLFDERFAEALSLRSARHRTSAMMIDIDHFKLYNDHYGHQAGDICLMTLAQCMEDCLKPHGFLVARTGGEEFSVLLPGTSLDIALAHARELLKAINALEMPHEFSPTSTSVTVSIGVAAHQADMTTPSDIMRAADQAMYQAKTGGRNRVEAYRTSDQLSPVER
ncbi:diguanylate cyclase [Halomonas sp. MCCC 1A17488]|uniref:diguanylate cyclase n=1 Tax=Billgrantia sulfidoxydans TaxID=2733484 RepID=A0ABX7W6J3_9GAMM|nr:MULTISPECIES: diguanylate cyclase [Halomonas]MCE8014904.1 diguanylate cyclase [Halomonas sp. MCCC 1A17488]MCG3238237.1 diguanylate cyclase [Halomonas sp. MCCC 1A17488]QPP47999.1 diguanylate cyclase [Halomonas sp. SS10-MC5]QTP55307.1 diguanylate cyclase [Halomonas sulfidoxydans]